jgi:hypothetical protein
MTMHQVLSKIITRYLPVILLILFTTGCEDSGKNGIKTRISGSFPALKGRLISLSEIDIDKAIPIDTTRISESGKFSFKFHRPSAGFYLLKIDNRNYITLILDKEKEVTVSSEKKELRSGYEITGSADSYIYSQFEIFLETNRNKVDSLTVKYKDFQRSARFESMKLELDEDYKNVFNSLHQYATAVLDNHCTSLASLLIINRRFGQRKILEEEKDYAYYVKVDSCLSSKYPDNKHFISFHKRVSQLKQVQSLKDRDKAKLAIGNKAPDITLENTSGNKISLFSLEGSPVIVYVWTSIDDDSRKANLQLKEIISRARISGLEVFAIGLESYKEMWTSAITQDGIEGWTNVTDYLNKRSSATSLYAVPEELPYFMLLDKELCIIYRGNDYTMLEFKLKEISK